MGGVFVSGEGRTKEEAEAKMTSERAEARKFGLLDERAKRLAYDEQRKVWVFAIWFHS